MIALVLAAQLTLTQPVVIDGDTLRDGSTRYRVENIDTPETGRRARCDAEWVAGERATIYARRVVGSARVVTAHPTGRLDRYGRVVAKIQVDGVDFGEAMMAGGHARPWRGRSESWCPAAPASR
jgi:endonuclease YncB( thermonuclease family)